MNATVVDLIVVVLRSLHKSIDACPKVSIWRHQGAPNICGDVLALEVGRLPFILLASLLCLSHLSPYIICLLGLGLFCVLSFLLMLLGLGLCLMCSKLGSKTLQLCALLVLRTKRMRTLLVSLTVH